MSASKARILVADDDAAVVRTVCWVLREQGYDVVAAADSETVFEQLEHHAPDLVILDGIADLDAFAVLDRIKREPRWRDLPVLVVADQPREDAAVRTLGLGASDFVRKPFRVRELLARIEAQLRVRHMLLDARGALRLAEEELARVRREAETRRKLVDIVHEVTGEVSAEEIFHLLARRVARALDLSHCSVILARPGDATGRVATAFEDPTMRDREIELARYPEIRTALEHGQAVLIEDLRRSPLHAGVRQRWQDEGTTVAIGSIIALPFDLDEEQAGVFFLRRTTAAAPLTREDAAFAEAVVHAAVAAIQRAHLLDVTRADNARLEALAQTDPLTLVLNRRALGDRLATELDRAHRYGSILTILMVDLDHFKDVNDTHGHLVGDEVLQTVARILATEARSSDFVARFGGEEFVIVLPETGVDGAMVFAERILELIGEQSFDPGRATFSVTASIGLASYPAPDVRDLEGLFTAADNALYRAKAAGRNRVML